MKIVRETRKCGGETKDEGKGQWGGLREQKEKVKLVNIEIGEIRGRVEGMGEICKGE